MVLQEINGPDPGALMQEHKTYGTASTFLETLFLLVDKEVNKEPDQELDGRGISKILYAVHHFKKYVKQK